MFKSQPLLDSDSLQMDKKVVAIDPGRVAIIHAIIYNEDGSILGRVRLTRLQYYNVGKINLLNSKMIKWNLRIKDALEAMSKNDLKTADLSKFGMGMNSISEWYPELVRELVVSKHRARAVFYTRGRKKSILRLTLNQFPSDSYVAYGNGNVAATAKYEMSVPTKEVKQLCEELYDTHETDEYNSSSTCIVPDCRGQLLPIYFVRNGRIFEHRGQKWCNSPQCAGCPLKHREDVGAANIFERFKHDKYGTPLPPLLDRSNPVQASRLPVKQRKNQYRLTAPHTSVPKRLRKKLNKKSRYDKRQRRYERLRQAGNEESDDNDDTQDMEE